MTGHGSSDLPESSGWVPYQAPDREGHGPLLRSEFETRDSPLIDHHELVSFLVETLDYSEDSIDIGIRMMLSQGELLEILSGELRMEGQIAPRSEREPTGETRHRIEPEDPLPTYGKDMTEYSTVESQWYVFPERLSEVSWVMVQVGNPCVTILSSEFRPGHPTHPARRQALTEEGFAVLKNELSHLGRTGL